MKIVILGCGRVGATLATQLHKAGHTVFIIDSNNDAFMRLDPEFGGAGPASRRLMPSSLLPTEIIATLWLAR